MLIKDVTKFLDGINQSIKQKNTIQLNELIDKFGILFSKETVNLSDELTQAYADNNQERIQLLSRKLENVQIVEHNFRQRFLNLYDPIEVYQGNTLIFNIPALFNQLSAINKESASVAGNTHLASRTGIPKYVSDAFNEYLIVFLRSQLSKEEIKKLSDSTDPKDLMNAYKQYYENLRNSYKKDLNDFQKLKQNADQDEESVESDDQNIQDVESTINTNTIVWE